MNGMDFFKEREMRLLLIAAILLTLQTGAHAGVRKVAKPQPVKKYTVLQPQCKNGKCPLKK